MTTIAFEYPKVPDSLEARRSPTVAGLTDGLIGVQKIVLIQ